LPTPNAYTTLSLSLTFPFPSSPPNFSITLLFQHFLHVRLVEKSAEENKMTGPRMSPGIYVYTPVRIICKRISWDRSWVGWRELGIHVLWKCCVEINGG